MLKVRYTLAICSATCTNTHSIDHSLFHLLLQVNLLRYQMLMKYCRMTASVLNTTNSLDIVANLVSIVGDIMLTRRVTFIFNLMIYLMYATHSFP